MHVANPRSPLNCQALSLHLPLSPTSQGSRFSGSSIPPTMSTSPELYYHSKSINPRYTPMSPPILSPAPKRRTPDNIQHGSRNSHGSHDLPDSPEYTTEALRSPLQFDNDASAYADGSNDELYSTAQDSPSTSSMAMGSPGVARRAKAHVPSACVNCKRKHLACETRRPCNRCLQSGKEASCVDVQHKKRGRPRLRDEDNNRGATYGSDYSHPHLYPAQPDAMAMQGSSQRHQYRMPYRELRSQPDTAYGPGPVDRADLSRSYHPGFPGLDPVQSYSTSQGLRSIQNIPEVNPTALLTLDFVISRSNTAFRDALTLRTQVEGKALKDLVIPSEKEKIQRLQNSLRTEMQQSAQSPYLRASMGEYASSNSPEEHDLFESTVGFTPRSEYWTFRLPNGQSRGFPISISLAKTDAFFVVLTLVSSTNSAMALPKPGSQSVLPLRMPTSTPYTGGQARFPDRLVERPKHRENTQIAQPYQSYTPKSVPDGLEGARLLEPSHVLDLGQYQQRSPSQTHDSGSNSSSLHGSDDLRENLRHLQLPPIRTSAIEQTRRPEPSKSSGPARKQSSTSVKASPGKRQKRRRVDIGEMLR